MTRYRIKVDMIACDGRGVCAERFPERITLDDWGYPILDPAPFGRDLLGHARAAMTACPVLALRLEPLQDDERRVARSRP